MYAPTGLDDLSSLIDGLETQITEFQLPQLQRPTTITILEDTEETLAY